MQRKNSFHTNYEFKVKGEGSPILDFECWAQCLSPVLGYQPLGGIAIHRQ